MAIIDEFDGYDHFVTVILVSVILVVSVNLVMKVSWWNGHFGRELKVILAIKRSLKSEITAIMVTILM